LDRICVFVHACYPDEESINTHQMKYFGMPILAMTMAYKLQFFSYKFVKGFSANTFLLLALSS